MLSFLMTDLLNLLVQICMLNIKVINKESHPISLVKCSKSFTVEDAELLLIVPVLLEST